MMNHFKYVFYSATHWLHAGGIFKKILNSYMDTGGQIPNQSHESLKFTQLIMLWLIWISGVTCGLIAFLFELKVGVNKKRRNKREKGRGRLAWKRGKHDNFSNNQVGQQPPVIEEE